MQLYQCEHCGKIEVIKEDFDEHVMQHDEIVFICKHCNLNFTSKDIMRDHIAAMHGSEKEFICDVCGKGFKNKYSLMLHYRRHTGEKVTMLNASNDVLLFSDYFSLTHAISAIAVSQCHPIWLNILNHTVKHVHTIVKYVDNFSKHPDH